MPQLSLAAFLLLLIGCASPPADSTLFQPITIERIFQSPNLDGRSPRNLKFSPDGKRVTYLREKLTDHKKLDLWEYHISEKKNRVLVDSDIFGKAGETLSAEEKTRRERKRISDSGIVEYFWSPSGKALVFPLNGALFYLPVEDSSAAPKRLTNGRGHDLNPHISFNARYVSFVRDQNLFYVDTKNGRLHQLTFDGRGPVTYGVAEFIAQEEMERFEGQWWSMDERRLAFTRGDESKVAVEKRHEINAETIEVHEQRYPRAGMPNAEVRLGIVDIASRPGQLKWLYLGPENDIYVARVKWLPDNRTLAVQIESRDQKRLDLVFYDVENGGRRTVLIEQNPHWINLHENLRFLKKSKGFVWSSDRTGFSHLYLYDLDGKLIRQLTEGTWPIRELVEIDEQEHYAYFTASRESPLEQQLYRVPLEGGSIEKISTEPGWHRISMSDTGDAYIDTFSNVTTPPRFSIRSSDGQLISYLEENRVDSSHPLAPYIRGFSQAEFGSFKKSDGTPLYYKLIKPRNYKVGKRYPLIVDVYGGPRRQMVTNVWSRRSRMVHQVWAQKGYIVFSIDNRGTAGRNRAFEDAIYHRLGGVEVEDQAAGVQWLIDQGVVDPARIGVFGWSYGGYMTVLLLSQKPELFKVGVAVAPVSDWALYDTHYTERFLGTPAENPEGYKASSVFPYLEGLKGKLLLMHGMADDNVLFTHSTKIYKALQDRVLPFDMMAYPGSKHGIYGEKLQTHVFRTIDAYFDRNLK